MILSPSIMCADLCKLGEEVKALESAGVDVFHLDIMDGVFVPNFALSWADVAAVRQATAKKIDVHLMVDNPALHLPHALKNGVDIVYVHFENGNSVDLLGAIRSNGAEAGLAINPGTDVSAIRHLLPHLDRVLVMRVNPGFAGQAALPSVDKKLTELIERKDGFLIGVDGAVSPDVVAWWHPKGVDEFILGTSSVFGRGHAYHEIVTSLRDLGGVHSERTSSLNSGGFGGCSE
jgi:ribulose-phosphate 3-epimerase